MEKKEFKKALTAILKEYDFEYINKAYYLSNDELIIVIDTQKSNFEDSFYLNYGILIKELNANLEYPKENLCDIRGRFILNKEGKLASGFSVVEGTVEELKESVVEGVETILMPVYENGASEYYKILPKSLSTATLKIKKYLELE